LGHKILSRPFDGLSAWAEIAYVKYAEMPIHTLAGKSANFRVPCSTSCSSASSSSRR
jgi:hypothetical protein